MHIQQETDELLTAIFAMNPKRFRSSGDPGQSRRDLLLKLRAKGCDLVGGL